MIREDKAKKLICPMTLNGDYDVCHGSECMAWRKVDQIGVEPDGKETDRDNSGKVKWTDRGYCGMAGKP